MSLLIDISLLIKDADLLRNYLIVAKNLQIFSMSIKLPFDFQLLYSIKFLNRIVFNFLDFAK